MRPLALGLSTIACCLALASTAAGASIDVTSVDARSLPPLTCSYGPISFTGGQFRFVTVQSTDRLIVHFTADHVTAADQDNHPYRLVGAGTDVFTEPGDTLVFHEHRSTLIAGDGSQRIVFWYAQRFVSTPSGETRVIGFDRSECAK